MLIFSDVTLLSFGKPPFFLTLDEILCMFHGFYKKM